jgi:hypothetical protein
MLGRQADEDHAQGFYFCTPRDRSAYRVHEVCVVVYASLIGVEEVLGAESVTSPDGQSVSVAERTASDIASSRTQSRPTSHATASMLSPFGPRPATVHGVPFTATGSTSPC